MLKVRLTAGLVIVSLLAGLALASTAWAKPDAAAWRGDHAKGRPIFGEILSISEDSITIAPKIPDFVAEKMAERGMDLPTDLPSEATISLTAETKWIVEGKKGDSSSFAVGDLVAIVAKPSKDGQRIALKIGDAASAKQFIKPRMQERSGQQGEWRGSRDQGERKQRGEQGKNRQHEMPAFGEIIALDGNSITIRPEVPAFIQAKMKEHGVKQQPELPDELVFTLGEKTHFVVDGEPTESNPFGVGDLVAVIVGKGKGKSAKTVQAVVDYATVEARLAEEGQAGRGGSGKKLRKPGAGGKRDKHSKGRNGQRE